MIRKACTVSIAALVSVLSLSPTHGGSAPSTKFSEEDIQSGRYIDIKRELRNRQFKSLRSGRSGFQGSDRPESLLGEGFPIERNLEELERSGLLRAELPVTPWSDDYWPIYRGVLGYRYADPDMANSDRSWREYFNYINRSGNRAPEILEAALAAPVANSSSLDQLSPSEKYDILVGDSNFTLTRQMWADGQRYAESNRGKVERWMGICHGWAAASYLLPRPTRGIEVLAADGRTRLTFRPSDIKALASLLWANGTRSLRSRFAGSRCNLKASELGEGDSARFSSPECFDSNPGNWHLTVTHSIGVAKRSFVMDATYDYEVWNHPIDSYSYTYFNPLTRKRARSLKNAQVSLERFAQKDPFASKRDPRTRSVVGIAMRVTYVVETAPSTAMENSVRDDSLVYADYLYDLELDENDEIIGGEWYEKTHPDFLWTFEPGARAKTAFDRDLRAAEWRPGLALPKKWTEPAQRASVSATPLAAVVEALIAASIGQSNASQ